VPTYDYKCENCSHTFEFFQSMKDEKLKICPECGGSLKRLIGSGSGPIFKGSGFYQTDYKNSLSKPKKETSGKTKPVESAKSSGSDSASIADK